MKNHFIQATYAEAKAGQEWNIQEKLPNSTFQFERAQGIADELWAVISGDIALRYEEIHVTKTDLGVKEKFTS